ncbi:hypothetical protein Cme02nite_34730 [Catellatospora methionotrophica]|uniref:Uncharacterized protein n=1 Tax=Catellatospora methionotrophica TaxID=121620 RepID=A0A8J3LH89_9ACTN|nr:hypothetical protein [Catellatospora methionotrophica]GIG15141.1 hypothetical protein Cme02nite_34730 [Catellatospora methionotrophica]
MVEPDVAQALRTGPFSLALDVAIEASGMTLERLSARLRDREVRLSRATLSYWRSGRSRPERGASLAALPVLEDLLGVPQGALSALLRGRGGAQPWAHRPAGSGSRRQLWPARPALLAQMNAPPDGQLEFLAVDDVFVVGEAGRSLRVRLVVRALCDGVGRAVVFHQANHGMTTPPQWQALAQCRLGRVRAEGRVSVAELVLDQRLSAGELTLLEYEVHFGVSDEEDSDFYYRTFTRRCRLWTCRVVFTGRVPSRVFRYRQRRLDDSHRESAELWLGGGQAAVAVMENVSPGVVGVHWDA